MQAAKRKVLIVEDEFMLYQELEEFFEEKGFGVVGHPDGKAVDNFEDAVKLLHENEPDIAVLDININGKKDGLELAAYIKEHFYTLIIMLTAYDNFENLERAKLISADGFVLKADKPVNKKQLWATISLTLPKVDIKRIRKMQGEFLKVREIDTKKITDRYSKPDNKYDTTHLDIETFIKWENITHIVSYNAKTAGEGNNNILMYTTTDHKGYIYRSTLSEISEQLPDYFVRFDQSTIVNLNHITAKGRGSSLYFVGNLSFKISERYKDDASDRLNNFLGDKF